MSTTLKPASEVKSQVKLSEQELEELSMAVAINTAHTHHILWNHELSDTLEQKLRGLGYTVKSTNDVPDNQPWPYIIGGF